MRTRMSVAAAVLTVLAAAGPAVAAPARGQTAATSAVRGDTVVAPFAGSTVGLTGHGWGHGFGLGQWGAYGYAVDYHMTSQQILDHFYAPSVASVTTATTMTVRLVAQDSLDLTVTSPSPFHAGGIAMPGGTAVRITRTSGGAYLLYPSFGCGQQEGAPTTVASPVVTSDTVFPGTDLSKMLQICRSGHKYIYRGSLALVYDGSQHTVNTVGLDGFVRGVVPNESPSYWGDAGGGAGMAALEAQAVASRTYALADNRYSYAKTCDSTSCQVYSGAGVDGTHKETTEGDTATFNTTGVIRKMTSGTVPSTQFSASSGGYSNSGGIFSPAVDLGDVESPYHNWASSLTVAQVQAAYPSIGTLTSITVNTRNGYGDGGGRVASMTVSGTSGSVSTSGTSFQLKFGLRSNWFFVGSAPPDGPTFYLENSRTTPAADVQFSYGAKGDRVLMCDWNGDGIDTPAVVHNGTWEIRNSNTTGSPETVLQFGNGTDIPVCGDWNGDGTDTVGVFRSGHWYLRNTNTTGVADVDFVFGVPGDVPVTGHWNHGAVDSVGVFRRGTWFLRNADAAGPADITFQYGNSTDVPLTGDWNGDGVDTIAVKRGYSFYLRNTNTSGVADVSFNFGNGSDIGLAGNWNTDAYDTIGLARGF